MPIFSFMSLLTSDLLSTHFFITIVEISKQAVSFLMINTKCDLGV
uniref:Uncharacterized protein n=1 Tax=Setaria viridis TaxID=4556 RepID=A0A4U6SP92_SETVI|nr:hypothetical protein SEVIR_9G025866v2 [Setaria viridis]